MRGCTGDKITDTHERAHDRQEPHFSDTGGIIRAVESDNAAILASHGDSSLSVSTTCLRKTKSQQLNGARNAAAHPTTAVPVNLSHQSTQPWNFA